MAFVSLASSSIPTLTRLLLRGILGTVAPTTLRGSCGRSRASINTRVALEVSYQTDDFSAHTSTFHFYNFYSGALPA